MQVSSSHSSKHCQLEGAHKNQQYTNKRRTIFVFGDRNVITDKKLFFHQKFRKAFLACIQRSQQQQARNWRCYHFLFRFASLLVKLIAPPDAPPPPPSPLSFHCNKMFSSAGCSFQVLTDNQKCRWATKLELGFRTLINVHRVSEASR